MTVVILAMQTQIPRLLEERNKYGKNLRTNAVQSLSPFDEKSMSNPAVDNCSVRGCTYLAEPFGEPVKFQVCL